MTLQITTEITLTGPVPTRDDPDNFDDEADVFLPQLPVFGDELNDFTVEANAVAVEVNTNALAAAASAIAAAGSAEQAAVTADAATWVSGQTYALHENAISLVDNQTYRKITATAGGVVDPASNPTDWTKITAVSFGAGGTTITGSVVLTVLSAAAMSVTPTAPGLYVTLPDATTCTKATAPFSIYNAGDYDYGVKNSAGTQLGWVKPRTGAVIGLADKTTAAGVWALYGLEKVGITADYVNAAVANMGDYLIRIAVDANRTCFLFGGTDCYAIVYDSSTQSWGAATLVRATIGDGKFAGVLSAAGQVMAVTCDSTTGMEAVTLTITGTGVTVNTANKATATLNANLSTIGDVIAVSTSFVVSYRTATPDGQIRALTVSANTPTIGAAATLDATAGAGQLSARLFASGAVVRTLVGSGTALLACKPFTVTGSSLAAGTQVTAAMTGSSSVRAFVNGNGNIVAQYLNTSHFASIFKLTGTVEAVSSVTLGTAPASVVSVDSDCIPLTASKTVFVSKSGSAWYSNILTDTAGTATAGTQTATTMTAAVSAVQAIMVSGNNARLGVAQSTIMQSQFTVDCSGASPSITSAVNLGLSSSSTSVPTFTSSDLSNKRKPSVLLAGAAVHLVGDLAAVADTEAFAGSMRYAPRNATLRNAGVTGAAANESWLGGVPISTIGFKIQRVEFAA